MRQRGRRRRRRISRIKLISTMITSTVPPNTSRTVALSWELSSATPTTISAPSASARSSRSHSRTSRRHPPGVIKDASYRQRRCGGRYRCRRGRRCWRRRHRFLQEHRRSAPLLTRRPLELDREGTGLRHSGRDSAASRDPHYRDRALPWIDPQHRRFHAEHEEVVGVACMGNELHRPVAGVLDHEAMLGGVGPAGGARYQSRFHGEERSHLDDALWSRGTPTARTSRSRELGPV